MRPTPFRSLHVAFAALATVSLALTLTLAPHIGGFMRTGAAGSCPANKSHLVPWLGGRWFLSGANVPWQNGGFGADFGTIEAWGQHTYSSATTDKMFADLRASGANSVRWWVFTDGRGAPEFNGGFVTGFDANTLPSMADAITLAEKHNIYLTFTLWSFDMLFPASGPAGGKRDLIVDAAKRQSFIDKALVPMLRHPVPGSSYTIGTHPNVISWEIINEPEWGISEAGSVHASIPQPVSLAEMQRFIAETTGAIHRNSTQLVTVGAAAMKWNSNTAPGAAGNWYSDAALKAYDAQGALDYYQVHYYAWTNGDANWSFSPMLVSWQQATFDKPVVVGEFPANASGSGMSVHQMLESIYGNCYAGAWSWGYHAVDGNGGWAETAPGMAQFNAAHSAEVQLPGGGAGSPPATATPVPTAAPAQPTAAPGGGEHIVYADALGGGWLNWSWSTNLVLNYGTVVKVGSRSTAVTHTGAWAGFRLHTNTAVSTAGLGKISFWVHGGAQGGQALQLMVDSGAGWGQAVRLPAPQANAWSLVEVPLSQLGSPARISDIAIQEAGGALNRTFYVDQLTIAPDGVGQSQPAAPATATPVPATAAPATATPVPATPVPATATPAPAQPTAAPAPPTGGAEHIVYADGLGSGWLNWSWSSKLVLNYGTIVKVGSRSAAVTYQSNGAGFRLHNNTPLATAGLGRVRFWAHGGTQGGQTIQVYLESGSVRSAAVKVPALKANTWSLVEVPLSQLGSPARISDIAIQEAGGGVNRTLYIDQLTIAP